jgi:broad specificity phosphatase PhoE
MGRRPIPLSERGRAQADAVVPLVRTLGPVQLLSSPIARAQETAAVLGAALGLPVSVEADLAEVDYGAWEGRSYADLVQDPAYTAFCAGAPGASSPAGEEVRTAQARALAAIRRLLLEAPPGPVCVVSHGDLIRLLLAAFLGLAVEEFRRLRIDTCGLSVVELTDAWAEVKAINLVADAARIREQLHWGR